MPDCVFTPIEPDEHTRSSGLTVQECHGLRFGQRRGIETQLPEVVVDDACRKHADGECDSGEADAYDRVGPELTSGTPPLVGVTDQWREEKYRRQPEEGEEPSDSE